MHGTAAAVAIGALLAGGALTALPASAAALPRPAVKLVAGDRTISAAWAAVPQATSYTVRISTKRSLAHARIVTTAKRSAVLKALRNGRPYYVAVSPNRPGVVAAASTSTVATAGRGRVATAIAHRGVPFPVTRVTASPGELEHQVRVDWTGGGRATKVAVIAGSSVITNERPFHSAWYPATTRSITITVPEELRPYLGGGTGNPVWVKVVQSNSTSTAFGPSYSSERKYRPSPVGTWSFAKAAVPAAAVSRLRVAELNTQSVEATARYTATNRWAARAPRVAKYIELADPDLLLTAELSTGLVREGCENSVRYNTFPCAADTQVADLDRRLDGLRVAGSDAYQRVIEMMRAHPSWGAKVTAGAHVLYDPAKLTLLDHGFYSPALTPAQSFADVEGLGVSPWDKNGPVGSDRWASWAKLALTDGSNRQFYAVAAHFPVGDAASVVAARADLAKKLTAAIDRRAGTLPVVLGADMNSDAVRSPKAPQATFMRNGWFDAAATPAKSMRTGMRVSTANGSGAQDGADSGYGSKPVLHPYETSRIDYILLKRSPYSYRYANMLTLHSNGTFRKDLQGTDHNMQLAEIGIADPVG